MSFATYLIVMLGGALGTLARFAVSEWTLPISQDIPWGTIGINVTGSLLVGFFGTLTLAQGRYPVAENVRLFVMVGFCGGYTTFSAFSLQTLDLMRQGAMGRAAVNVCASVAVCIIAVAAGHLAASHFNGHAEEIAQLPIEKGAS
jgi:CrcB protein